MCEQTELRLSLRFRMLHGGDSVVCEQTELRPHRGGRYMQECSVVCEVVAATALV